MVVEISLNTQFAKIETTVLLLFGKKITLCRCDKSSLILGKNQRSQTQCTRLD